MPAIFRSAMLGSVTALALAAALGACAPRVAYRGHTPDPQAIEQVKVGTTTRAEVQRLFGSPSAVGTFDPDIWYYVGEQTEKVAFFETDVVDRKLLAIRFDKQGVVNAVGLLGAADGRDVELVARTTPTAGNETTLFQDLFGNIGRFAGKSDANTRRGPPGL